MFGNICKRERMKEREREREIGGGAGLDHWSRK